MSALPFIPLGPSLYATSDPTVLVPGSAPTLEADAANLDDIARTLADEADTLRSASADGWEGDAADGWAERRKLLTETLEGVAGAHQTAAYALRGHASTVRWAQGRAAVAVRLWAQGVALRAAAGLPPLLGTPASSPFEQDPGQGHRDLAESVLASARTEVATSASAAKDILAALDDGLPDGKWHAGDFARGAWSWVTGMTDMVAKFNGLRMFVDPQGFAGDAAAVADGALNTWNGLMSDPFTTGRAVLDLDLLHDRPAEWWGGLAPDAALAVFGAGAAAWATRSARVADYIRALELGEELPGGGLYPPSSIWNDPVARQKWIDDLLSGPDSGSNKVVRHLAGDPAAWQEYQRRIADPEVRLNDIWADGVHHDPDGVAAIETKYVSSPGKSIYEGTAPKWLVDKEMARFDDEMRRYRDVIDDATNPVARLRIYTSTPEAAEFLEARARSILGAGFELQVVVER